MIGRSIANSCRIPMSPTLATEAALNRRRRAGERILDLGSGEVGLPVLPELIERLAANAHLNAYGPVVGSVELREAAAGYWNRRGLETEGDDVVCGPGSKSLLLALVHAIGGDVILASPSWVSYAAHAQLAGVQCFTVGTRTGEGGVPDPVKMRGVVQAARRAGHSPSAVITTLPDNPTGSFASPRTVREFAQAASELDLIIISDEIYADMAFGPPITSPAAYAPLRTVVTTGLSKSLALAGWRIGVARIKDPALREAFAAVASQMWSTTAAPIQAAAAYAFEEPPEIRQRIKISRELHLQVATAVGDLFRANGASVPPQTATCFVYPDLKPVKESLGALHQIRNSFDLAAFLLRRHGTSVLPGEVFGDSLSTLRIRVAIGQLYGRTVDEQATTLATPNPLALPWVEESLAHLAGALADLTCNTITNFGE